VASTEKSLSALNAVVRALADNPGKRHVPYRDSKLTRLLSGTLSGAGRLVVIICASPAASAADETRTALHFGTAAARVVARPQPVCVPLDASAFGSLQRQEAALTMRLVR
jgi:Kinesin motor domain